MPLLRSPSSDELCSIPSVTTGRQADGLPLVLWRLSSGATSSLARCQTGPNRVCSSCVTNNYSAEDRSLFMGEVWNCSSTGSKTTCATTINMARSRNDGLSSPGDATRRPSSARTPSPTSYLWSNTSRLAGAKIEFPWTAPLSPSTSQLNHTA